MTASFNALPAAYDGMLPVHQQKGARSTGAASIARTGMRDSIHGTFQRGGVMDSTLILDWLLGAFKN
jgi:hypothetical protein